MPTPVTDPDLLAQLNAPARADVQPSRRVWGDQEAQASGLYETPVPAGLRPVSDPALLQQLNGKPGVPQITVRPSAAVAERFEQPSAPANEGELRSGLEQRAQEMTRGPRVAPAVSMAIEHGNLLAAASQGTTPTIDAYRGRLVSADVHEDDGGNILYRDTQTGQLVPTNNETQVALRDPADNRIKVFARSDKTDESGVVGASRVLVPGMVTGAPASKLGSAATKTMAPGAQDIIQSAKPSYRAFDAVAANTPVYADEAKNMVDRVQNALDAAHYPAEVAKQVHDTVALIGKKGDTALDQLQYVKRAVGNLFKSPDENVRKAAGVATGEIVRVIGEMSPTALSDLKKADAIRQTGRAKQVLETNTDIASLRTGRAGYGGNAVNNMRSFVEKVVEADVKGFKTPFKPDEIQAMRELVDGNVLTNALRNIGGMSMSKGGLQIGLGVATLGTSAVAGAAANKLATILTRSQLNRLEEQVAKRSPAYKEAVVNAVNRFNKAQEEIAANPTAKHLAAYISASRALSGGLTKDGIQITSGQLLRSIQGPMKSAAEDDQPAVPRRPGE